jgi:hypothetical protein
MPLIACSSFYLSGELALVEESCPDEEKWVSYVGTLFELRG